MVHMAKMTEEELELSMDELDNQVRFIRNQKREIRDELENRRGHNQAEAILDTLTEGQIDALVHAATARMNASATDGKSV